MSATGNANILDYLPPGSILLLDDPAQIEAEIERIEEQALGLKSTENGSGDREPTLPYFGWEQISEKLANSDRIIELSEWDVDIEPSPGNMRIPIEHAPNFAARFSVLMDNLPGFKG